MASCRGHRTTIRLLAGHATSKKMLLNCLAIATACVGIYLRARQVFVMSHATLFPPGTCA